MSEELEKKGVHFGRPEGAMKIQGDLRETEPHDARIPEGSQSNTYSKPGQRSNGKDLKHARCSKYLGLNLPRKVNTLAIKPKHFHVECLYNKTMVYIHREYSQKVQRKLMIFVI